MVVLELHGVPAATENMTKLKKWLIEWPWTYRSLKGHSDWKYKLVFF